MLPTTKSTALYVRIDRNRAEESLKLLTFYDSYDSSKAMGRRPCLWTIDIFNVGVCVANLYGLFIMMCGLGFSGFPLSAIRSFGLRADIRESTDDKPFDTLYRLLKKSTMANSIETEFNKLVQNTSWQYMRDGVVSRYSSYSNFTKVNPHRYIASWIMKRMVYGRVMTDT